MRSAARGANAPSKAIRRGTRRRSPPGRRPARTGRVAYLAMRLALAGLLLAAACGPIDGGVVARTGSPIPSASVVSSAAPATSSASAPSGTPDIAAVKLVEFPVGRGQGPHDVAPAPDGGVSYTAQRTGELG